MTKVLYNTCVADPWLDVAMKLKKEKGFNPVYWIGYSYDNSISLVPEQFPEICYQSTEDAWKGIFPDVLNEFYFEESIDIDFLRKYSVNINQCFTMMNRLDFDRYSFNLMERERELYRLVKYWKACRKYFGFNLVLSAVNPHRIYDYVLYLLCREWNIPFIVFQYTMCPGRIYAISQIFSTQNIFTDDYIRNLESQNLTWEDISEDISSSYKKVIDDYSKAEPWYMLKSKSDDKKCKSITALAGIYIKRNHLYGRGHSLLMKNKDTCFKKRNIPLEKTSRTILEYFVMYTKRKLYMNMLKKYYEDLSSPPVTNEKYVYFPMHYQPEETTCPSGDIFVNQALAIETIAKNVPNDVLVYVREHPSQFMSQFLGQTSRIKEFYTDLSKNPKIRIISISVNPYELMNNAIAVATITGTVGWESICNKKPVIIFGLIWYECCPGVLRIVDDNSAQSIMDFIHNYQYSEKKLLAYLKSVSQNTVKAYHYDGYQEYANVSKEESVNNICQQISRMLK